MIKSKKECEVGNLKISKDFKTQFVSGGLQRMEKAARYINDNNGNCDDFIQEYYEKIQSYGKQLQELIFNVEQSLDEVIIKYTENLKKEIDSDVKEKVKEFMSRLSH